jgi:hypothetical protein
MVLYTISFILMLPMVFFLVVLFDLDVSCDV